MDQWHLVIGGISFGAGFWLRASLEQKPESPVCQCQCQWTGAPPAAPAPQGGGQFFWITGVVSVVCAILVLRNVALVCRISFKDSVTGADREVQINVKGKSKGVYGAPRGLSLTA